MELTESTVKRKAPFFLSLDFVLFLAVVAIHLYPVFKFRHPWMLSDEFCYLATAAWLGGRDWSGVVAGSAYYSFGSAALLTPFFRYGFPAEFIYQVALLINGFLGGTVFLSALYCGRRLVEHASVSRATISLAAVAMALYPSHLAYSHSAMAETALTAAYWGTFALSFRIATWANSHTAPALFGAIVGSLWMIHRRSVAVIIAATLVVFLAWRLRLCKRRPVIAYLMSLGILFTSALLLDNYFEASLWRGNLLHFRSHLFDLPRVIFGGIRAALGQIFYLGVATNLLALIGFFISAQLAWIGFFKRRSQDYSNSGGQQDRQRMIAVMFATTAALFAFGLSVFIMIRGYRFDHIVYGRYNEAFIGPLVLLALLAISGKIQTRVKLIAISAALLLILTTILFYFQAQEVLEQRVGYYTTIIGLFPYRTDVWTIQVLPTLAKSLIFSAIIFALIWHLPRAGLVIISVAWGIIAFYVIANQFVPAAERLRNPHHITKWLRNHGVHKGICFLRHSRSGFHHQMYQWWMDDFSQIEVKNPYSPMNNCRYAIVHASKLNNVPLQSALLEADPEWSYSLWVYPGSEKARLEKQGIRFLDPSSVMATSSNPGLMPADEYRSTLTRTDGEHNLLLKRSILSALMRRLRISDSIGIRVKHEGKNITWPSTVRVGARWYKRGKIGGHALAEERADLPDLRPGEQTELKLLPRSVDKGALPPGDYSLLIGLVQEGITWFSAQGDKDLVLDVVIAP